MDEYSVDSGIKTPLIHIIISQIKHYGKTV